MQNKFYTIKPIVNSKITGTYPQIGIKLDYNKSSDKSIWNLKSMVAPSFSPDFDCLYLVEKALPSNLLSTGLSIYGMLIDHNLQNTFNKYNLQKHSYHTTNIEYKSVDLKYYWLHFEENTLLDLIDFPSSTFHVVEFGFRKNSIEINSIDHYFKKRTELMPNAIIKSDQIKLKSLPVYDLFVIPFIDGTYYISENLKEDLLKSNYTGIDINLSKSIDINNSIS